MAESVKITFLGGLGEIGRNCFCLEIDNRILLVDFGLMFPDLEMPGVDLVLPDFTWLRENKDRVEACVVTHGHEDHVGGLNFLLRELSFPIYASALTLGLARGRLEEAGVLGNTDLRPVSDGERVKIGPFDVEFIPVTHSVPHAHALAFRTPQGVILHSGDWKIDLTPVDGRTTDLGRMGAIATTEGIRLLLSDSTNAEEPGYTTSEREVGGVLRGLFREHERRRIVIACFASHIHRISQIVDAAIGSGRKVATLGRSMQKNLLLARTMGLITVDDAHIVDIERIGDYDPAEICVVSTGSQGEPMSALSLMAAGDNKWIKLGPDDTVILSSHAIPGNEMNVGKVIDGLIRLGAEVVHSGLADVHVSGHAQQGELKTLLSVASPEFFIPVHGEFRHLTHHARLAMQMGIPDANVLLCEDGDVIELGDRGAEFVDHVPAGYLYVDGIVGDVGNAVLRDRKVLAEEGVIVVVVTLDARTGEMLTEPEIITRGWVYAPEAEGLLDEAKAAVRAGVAAAAAAGGTDFETMKRHVRQGLARFVKERTSRRPMIVPIVMEV
ncbi:MAG TPA: ribonuclease J [Acidimicrobiales bacterium]|nr:ribonuclease J [Acidimicrobiales bacterium]